MTMLAAETDRYDVQANYTFSKHFAVGASYMRVHHGNATATFAFPQLNWLVKRWNGQNSQANIYLYGGLGYRNDEGKNGLGGFAGGEADYETRRFYTSIQQQTLFSGSANKYYRTSFKVGGAPYLADYDKLSTWIIFKTEYASYMEPSKKLSFSPGLRFLYKNFFVEGGGSPNGVWYVNLMAVF